MAHETDPNAPVPSSPSDATEAPPQDENPPGGPVRALGDRFQEATATLLELAGSASDAETARKYLRAAGHLVFAMAEIVDVV